MGWVDRLRGTTVALDTAPLIYFIEEHPKYLPVVLPFFELVEEGEVRCVTSVLTITESLVHPLRRGRSDLAKKYLSILLDSNLIAVEVTREIAADAAELRANLNLRTPDAIQVSTAVRMSAAAMLTNDLGIPAISDVEIVNIDDLLRSTY